MKVNRLTDYATLIICEMANDSDRIISAKDLSEKTKIGQATVVKLLKMLEKKELLKSYRGQAGGYKLEKGASEISVLDIMIAIEGGMSLTLCGAALHNACKYNAGCKVKQGWNKLNQLFLQALKDFTVKDFMGDTAKFKLEKVS
jgi:FeS assembly SUF system regulator